MTNRKSVLITGASGDIGQSLCQGFKELDWKVIATDTNRIQSINADHFIEMDLDLICNDDIYCDGKVVSILEGGYDILALQESTQEHVEALIEFN